jgi:hypothetical protein
MASAIGHITLVSRAMVVVAAGITNKKISTQVM